MANEGLFVGIPDPKNVSRNVILVVTSQHPGRGDNPNDWILRTIGGLGSTTHKGDGTRDRELHLGLDPTENPLKTRSVLE